MRRFIWGLALVLMATPWHGAQPDRGPIPGPPGIPTLLLGVAWYPEHWPEERWVEDLKLMQAAGIRVVRIAEFAWSRLDPREGEFDLDWLERVVALNRRRVRCGGLAGRSRVRAIFVESYFEIQYTAFAGNVNRVLEGCIIGDNPRPVHQLADSPHPGPPMPRQCRVRCGGLAGLRRACPLRVLAAGLTELFADFRLL